MKFLFALTVFFALTAGGFAGIVFEKETVIVPCEPGQDVVTAEFSFKVEDAKPLSIMQIRTMCDCTDAILEVPEYAEADAPEYAAGGTGKITVKFNVSERLGFQKKIVVVKTSDGREARAIFQTTVPPVIEFSPAFVFWRKNEKPTPKEIAITVVYKNPVNVTGIAPAEQSAFDTELKTIEAGKRYTLRITPRTPEVSKTERIVLKTDFPKDTGDRFVVVASVK